jgi:uncharacterized protein (DUF488 family)
MRKVRARLPKPEKAVAASSDQAALPSAETRAFFTIGHSTRPIEAFLEQLAQSRIELLVDVRTVPRSRTNPQFNTDVLAEALAGHAISYRHAPDLGGLRSRQQGVAPTVNAFWENDSFHNYADYAMSRNFQDALTELRALGARQRCAIMCAEAVWWRCHRRIIADYLIAAGEAVFHILGPNHVEPAHVTEAVRPGPDGVLTYPGEPLLL